MIVRKKKTAKASNPSLGSWDCHCTLCHEWRGNDAVGLNEDGVCSYCAELIERGSAYDPRAIIELAGRLDGYRFNAESHADHLVVAMCWCLAYAAKKK